MGPVYTVLYLSGVTDNSLNGGIYIYNQSINEKYIKPTVQY